MVPPGSLPGAMARWGDLEDAEPDFAGAVRARFDAYRHKLVATIRADGSPRLSGIEITFRDGDLWLGSMPGAAKGRDLRRDPRLALHTSSPDPDDDDPSAWAGDAKLDGRAELVEDPAEFRRYAGDDGGPEPGAFDLFRIDVLRVSTVRVGDPPDHLVIETWRPDAGLRRIERA